MKKVNFLFVALSFLVFACTPKVAEKVSEPMPADTPKEEMAGDMASEIINNYVSAIGGKDALMSVTDIQTTMEANTGMGPIKMNRYVKGGKFAMQVMAQGMTVQEIKYDGETAKMSDMQGDQEITDPKQLEGFAQQSQICPELEYANNGYEITYVGEDKHKGQDVHILKVVTPSGTTMQEYYSKESGLKIFMEGETEMNGQTQNSKTSFEDYREVGGIKFPHSISISGAMPFELNMEVTSIKVNEGISDTVFMNN